MVQVELLAGRKSTSSLVFPRFPVRVGRAPNCQLQLVDDGVWDDHALISLRPREGFFIAATSGGTVLINGESVHQGHLANGDIVTIGAAQFRFGFTAPPPKAMWPRELLTWAGLAGLCASQGLLIYWLLL